MRRSACGGFTLVEVVLSIAVVAIVFGSSMTLFQQILESKYRNEAFMKAAYLAHQELERVTQMRYSEIQDENAGSRGNLIAFPAPNESFNYEVIVDPVIASNLDGPPVSTSAYHRIYVDVQNDVAGTVRLTSLVTDTD